MSDRIIRYLRCDLDRIEEIRFLEDVARDAALATTLGEAYDAHVEQARLLAFIPAAPEFTDCFSLATLEEYAEGQLTENARAIVLSHLACPLCGPQVDRLGEAAPKTTASRMSSRFRSPKWRTRRAQTGLILAAGLALLFLLWPSPQGQLPNFSIVEAHAEAQLHADPGIAWNGASVTVARGSHLKLRLNSDSPLNSDVSLSFFFVGPEEAHAWSPGPRVTHRSIIIHEAVPDALFQADTWSLLIGVSISDEGPSLSTLRGLIETPDPESGTQVFVVPIETQADH